MGVDGQYREQPKWRQLFQFVPCRYAIKDCKMQTPTLLCAVLLFLSTTASDAQNSSAVIDAASAIGWTTENAAKLKAVFHDTNTVTALYNQTFSPGTVGALNPQAVGEYLIVDLSNDGQLELLCTADASGRAFYTDLTVFSQQKGKIVRFDVSTHGANFVHLSSGLADLNHDGKREMLVWCPRNNWLFDFLLSGSRRGATGLDLLESLAASRKLSLDGLDGGSPDKGFGIFIPGLQESRNR